MRLKPPISIEEIRLAARDIPENKAVGPDVFPAEFYKTCAELHGLIAIFFNCMLERGHIPPALTRFFIVPLDKAGKDPTNRSSNRPVALLCTLIKLRELVLARRIQPILEGRPTRGQ